MKRFILVVLAVLAIASVANAQANVVCLGTESGGGGLRLYHYYVSTGQKSFTSFAVGTCDGFLPRYTNWILPVGWSVSMVAFPIYPHYAAKTPHGVVSPGPNGKCSYYLSFAGPAIQAGVFAYDHPWRSHDVGWMTMTTDGGAVVENWFAPVGAGMGPVHAPVPEPGSLLALGSGLTAFAGSMTRRRRQERRTRKA